MVENNHVHAPYMMESVLQEIGLGHVPGKFTEEKVDTGVIMLATFPPRSSGRFICLSDKICDKIPNPIQEEVSKKGRAWTEENCI